MRPTRLTIIAALLATGSAFAGAAAIDASTKAATATSATTRFAVYDAKGRPAGTAAWRVSDAGGNCCEVYVESTARGKLVEFGGETPWVSDDAGHTWKTVQAVVPFVFGEGSGTPAPNGDVVGAMWDYTQGDRLTAYRWSAATNTWATEEIPVRGFVYDRPYVAVVPGPFTIDGKNVPFLSVLNTHTSEGDVLWTSTDGLSYELGSWALDEGETAPVKSFLDTTKNAAIDWSQGMPGSEITPLGRGALARVVNTEGYLREVSGATCTTYVIRPPDARWHCFTLPRGDLPEGPMTSDSRGWLHTAEFDGSGITVGTSTNGGASWRRTRIALPRGTAGVADVTVRANGRLGRLAVASHTRDGEGRSRFLLTILDARTPALRVLRTYQLGRGDKRYVTTSGEAIESNDSRVDFPSVTFLPDGRVAASFNDSTHKQPVLAFLDQRV